MKTNKPLKVLVIIPSAFCFGLQHVSIDLLGELNDRVEPHFLVTHWNDGEFIKLLNKHNFSYRLSWLGMFSRKLDWYNLRMSIHAMSKIPVLYLQFVRAIKQQKPTILLFANYHELILLSPILPFIKIPVICHMHDPAPAIAFQKRTFRWYGARVNRFIAISESVKNRLMLLGCKENKISVVYNGIRLTNHMSMEISIYKSQFGWPKDSFIVGITGQMTATKGHEDLLDAFVLASTQNSKIKLIIGGKKMEPLYSTLLNKIRDQDLQGNVAFTGWVEDVSEFYENIDLFVLASRHDEGYGLVVAESMAHGKPVIITDSGGASEIVINGTSGFIVPKNSVNLIAERILTLSRDSSLYKTFSLAARERIKNDFDLTRTSSDFFNVLANSRL